MRQPIKDRAGQYIGRHFFGHKTPADRASELFKPSLDSAGLLVEIEIKFLFSVWGSLAGPPQVGVFLLFLANFGRPWTPTHWAILLAHVFFGN